MKYIFATILSIALCMALFITTCKSRKQQDNIVDESTVVTLPMTSPAPKLGKAIFYLENSGSMFGYVNGGAQDYKKVIAELKEHPKFVKDSVAREFYLVNGHNLILNKINPNQLNNNLNPNNFNVGNIQSSNLNAMLEKAMSQAEGDTITFLVSDGIYDMGNVNNPLAGLVIEGKVTRSKFIQRLLKNNVATILIKLTSHFNGNYYYASKPGSININLPRPYYIWIFGDADRLFEYFPDSYLEKLPGYNNSARFYKVSGKCSAKVVSYCSKGIFKIDKTNKLKITNAKPDPLGNFGFSVAANFSPLGLPLSYLSDMANYECSQNYEITEINITPTEHWICLSSKGGMYGNVEICLKNNVPVWIEQTGSNTESNINNDSDHTYGFEHLTKSIEEAYKDVNKTDFFHKFLITVSK